MRNAERNQDITPILAEFALSMLGPTGDVRLTEATLDMFGDALAQLGLVHASTDTSNFGQEATGDVVIHVTGPEANHESIHVRDDHGLVLVSSLGARPAHSIAAIANSLAASSRSIDRAAVIGDCVVSAARAERDRVSLNLGTGRLPVAVQPEVAIAARAAHNDAVLARAILSAPEPPGTQTMSSLAWAKTEALRKEIRLLRRSRTWKAGRAVLRARRSLLQAWRLPIELSDALKAPPPPARRRPSSGELTRSLKFPGDRTIVMRVPPGLHVPRMLADGGLARYEPEALACFAAVLDTASQQGHVLDIGANVGVYGLLARAISSRRVVAFEPTPSLARLARRISIDNGLVYPVVEQALGSTSGQALFYLSDVTDSSNSLASGFRASSHQLVVDVTTLDEWCARTGVQPALLKIDTETTEPGVISGAEAIIARCRPWILCEVLPGRTEADLMRVMEPFGYHYYLIGDDIPLQSRRAIQGHPSHYMWLFAPEAPSDILWVRMRAWRRTLDELGPIVGPVPTGGA